MQSGFAGSVWTVPMTQPQKRGTRSSGRRRRVFYSPASYHNDRGSWLSSRGGAATLPTRSLSWRRARIFASFLQTSKCRDQWMASSSPELIRDRWPPIELIITSGRHIVEADELPSRGHFLPKPWRLTFSSQPSELWLPDVFRHRDRKLPVWVGKRQDGLGALRVRLAATVRSVEASSRRTD